MVNCFFPHFYQVCISKRFFHSRSSHFTFGSDCTVEELKIVFFLSTGQDVWRRSSLHPPKTNLAGNRDEACLCSLLSSTFLWCCNFQISALERTLSGCLLSISFDFTPFPVKLISARPGIRMYTCRCISPNGEGLTMKESCSHCLKLCGVTLRFLKAAWSQVMVRCSFTCSGKRKESYRFYNTKNMTVLEDLCIIKDIIFSK